ncbi:MAG: hypothetical protein WB510_13635 [Candidatus Sulfotelmatobacter sp.]
MPDDLTTLYRPMGRKELELIRQTGFHSFPPRLPSQPIFYPVLTYEYAVKIARDWNTKDAASDYEGYVLRFFVRTDFLSRYQVRLAGGSSYREYWIPSADLNEFNRNIVGAIEVLQDFKRS